MDDSWRTFFEGYEFALSGSLSSGAGDNAEANVEAFVNLYRRLGHLNAHLNPLDEFATVRESFDPALHGLGDVDRSRVFRPANLPVEEATFDEVCQLLEETYCGNIGADFRDINDIDAVVGCKKKWKVAEISRRKSKMKKRVLWSYRGRRLREVSAR